MRLVPALRSLVAQSRAPFIGLTLALVAIPASAQDEDLEALEDLEDLEDLEEETPAGEEAPQEGGRLQGAEEEVDEGPGKEQEVQQLPDFDAVRPIDRAPPPGTPLIANKLYPMQFRFELSGVFDYSFSNKFVSEVGAHASVAFHLFDWLAIEGWAGGLYPQELSITGAVRQQGYSATELGIEPQLGDLYQSFAFGGLGVQWAPLYGKFSMVSEFDLSFQLYFVGGMSVEATAKPQYVPPGTQLTLERDFFPGLIQGVPYTYWPRPSLTYGAGVRIIPWKWVAVRFEVRNLSGINPAYRDEDLFDFTNTSFLNLGLSILL